MAITRWFERHLKGVFKPVAKFALFNASVVLGYLVIIYIFAIPIEGLDEFGKYTVPILLGMGNVIFVMYEYILSNLFIIYDKRWHKHVAKIFGIR